MHKLKIVLRNTMPVMAGYIVLGTGFGLLLNEKGYGFFWSLAMSLFIYAGALQYVGVSLLSSSASLITVAITSLVINARHLFYGITMIGHYKDAGAKKPYLIHALTDETYSLVCTGEVPEGFSKHEYFFLVSLFDQIYWVTGSIIGSLIGSLITADMTGLEFSMTALFVTVVVEQWIKEKNHIPVLIGFAASIVSLLIFGADNFIIPDMIGIIILLSIFRKPVEEGRKKS
ncbi:MAG: AzlC family ABC transporter permease [Lachnospiraceae bacterium]|nr:AzlC family ABC transporter permease [Lachnospiraceae bacterium]